jgi:hypothetical protein
MSSGELETLIPEEIPNNPNVENTQKSKKIMNKVKLERTDSVSFTEDVRRDKEVPKLKIIQDVADRVHLFIRNQPWYSKNRL